MVETSVVRIIHVRLLFKRSLSLDHTMRLKSLLLLLFFLDMPGISYAHSYKVVIIHTHAFLDPRNGINRLINAGSACRDTIPDRHRQCVSQATQSIVQDIAKTLDDYASRNHLILFDADSHYEQYCIIEGEVSDITKEFIDYYNRAHADTQSNNVLQRSTDSKFLVVLPAPQPAPIEHGRYRIT